MAVRYTIQCTGARAFMQISLYDSVSYALGSAYFFLSITEGNFFTEIYFYIIEI